MKEILLMVFLDIQEGAYNIYHGCRTHISNNEDKLILWCKISSNII